jgi:hypothetical protein
VAVESQTFDPTISSTAARLMTITALTCPACGAPVSPSKSDRVVCAYCHHTLTGVPDASWDALLRTEELDDAADTRPWCRVASKKFLLRGLLARGERCDVLVGERDQAPTELVVIKVLRGEVNPDAFASESRLIFGLAASRDPDAPHMTTLLPQIAAVGKLTKRNRAPRTAIVHRWRSGFIHTLREVRAAYPDGVDVRTAVWMWRRQLDLLGWLHRNGVRHGAVLPEHVLVHPRDHAAALVGWSHAKRIEGPAGAQEDVEASARAILHATACDEGAVAHRFPTPLATALESALQGRADDARGLSVAVLEAATAAFGPPTYHPFTMPGWG